MMAGIDNIPEYIGTAAISAVVACIGYIWKLLSEQIGQVVTKTRQRRARLVELYSLLCASQTAFQVQCKNRDRLLLLLKSRHEDIATHCEKGYDDLFSKMFSDMNEDERGLHCVIRGITTNAMFELNSRLADWLKSDDYFKAKPLGHGAQSKLAEKLRILDSHLHLWKAKYSVWIPEYPDHALVYMRDEQEHGLGFPEGLDQLVEEALSKRLYFFL